MNLHVAKILGEEVGDMSGHKFDALIINQMERGQPIQWFGHSRPKAKPQRRMARVVRRHASHV